VGKNWSPGQSALPREVTRQPVAPAFSKGLKTVNEEGWPNFDLKDTLPQTQGKTLYRFKSSGIDVPTTAGGIILLSASAKRRYALVQVIGSSDVWIGFDTVPSVGGLGSIKLVPDAVYSFADGIVPWNEIYAIADSAVCRVNFVEGFEV